MADTSDSAVQPEVVELDDTAETERPDDAADGEVSDGEDEETDGDAVTEPAKVMRIGSMVKQLLEEVRNADLDQASRERLAEVYERSIVELSSALSPDLQEELRMLSLPFDDDGVPSEAELRVAKAQLVGWLEGLFHGIQASLMAQQYAAQQQLQQMKQLPGQAEGAGPGQRPGGQQPPQTGTYL
ncbi:proteasome activator [Ilumatobacter nonamiensis]|uniref:proteasome activator n=1 Tax=Ilumatobacter nonamiensis TaxID=467093 RepID=UPI00034BEA56|nr:proteasome activator [Ilumatobacter nonamiensis]